MEKPTEMGRSTDAELVEIAGLVRDLAVQLGAHELGADFALTTIDCHARVLIADIPVALAAAESRGRERGIEEAARLRALLESLKGEVHHWYANNLDPTQHMRNCPGCRLDRALSGNAASQATPIDPEATLYRCPKCERLYEAGPGELLEPTCCGKKIPPAPRSLVGTLYEPCARCGRTKGEHRDRIGGGMECPPFPASVLCPKYEPHPWSIYADDYCVGSIYVDGRPRLCGRPRKDHKP